MRDKVSKVPTSEDDLGAGICKTYKTLRRAFLVEKRVYVMLTKGSAFLTIIIAIK